MSQQLALYAALLSDSSLAIDHAAAALDPQLMSDSGTYEFSGVLDSAIVARLKAQHLIHEVCDQGKREYGLSECVTETAHSGIRLSRPILLDHDSVAVYVGRGTVYPTSSRDTFPFRVPYFGMTHRCTIVAGARPAWRVQACRIVMIT
jgi:hypothetical protein